MAELEHRRGNFEVARQYLQVIWDNVQRGHFRTIHADALIIKAKIQRDSGETQAAIDTATEAYKEAWFKGKPFSFKRALEEAKNILHALGAKEPSM